MTHLLDACCRRQHYKCSIFKGCMVRCAPVDPFTKFVSTGYVKLVFSYCFPFCLRTTRGAPDARHIQAFLDVAYCLCKCFCKNISLKPSTNLHAWPVHPLFILIETATIHGIDEHIFTIMSNFINYFR